MKAAQTVSGGILLGKMELDNRAREHRAMWERAIKKERCCECEKGVIRRSERPLTTQFAVEKDKEGLPGP